MQIDRSQTEILALAIYEIRQLLAGYLGASHSGDVVVREAAHLAYALHNEALAIIEGRTFDTQQAIAKIRHVDALFGEEF